jgi:hypothetical protein
MLIDGCLTSRDSTLSGFLELLLFPLACDNYSLHPRV